MVFLITAMVHNVKIDGLGLVFAKAVSERAALVLCSDLKLVRHVRERRYV